MTKVDTVGMTIHDITNAMHHRLGALVCTIVREREINYGSDGCFAEMAEARDLCAMLNGLADRHNDERSRVSLDELLYDQGQRY